MPDCTGLLRALLDAQAQGVQPALAAHTEMLKVILEAVTAEGPGDIAAELRHLAAAVDRNTKAVETLVERLRRGEVPEAPSGRRSP